MTYCTPYPELNIVLCELVAGVQQVLRDNFVGAYLQGSFAIGGFDEHSDVDFIIAIDHDLSNHQLDGLQTMHKRIFDIDSKWAQHLEGSYFPTAVLRNYARNGSELWYLEHGMSVLERSNHCNTVVVRWILREKGVVLSGAEPSALINPIYGAPWNWSGK